MQTSIAGLRHRHHRWWRRRHVLTTLRLAPGHGGDAHRDDQAATRLADGVAYATRHTEHLLNVPARRMSAFNDRPDDFVDFLVADDEGARGNRYFLCQRRHYGDHLRARLQRARNDTLAHFEVRHERVTAIEPRGRCMATDPGIRFLLQARGIVLAVGNTPKPLPARGASSLPAQSVLEACWDFDSLKRIPTDAEVCIAGSGLNMVDHRVEPAGQWAPWTHACAVAPRLLPLPHTAHSVATLETGFLQRLSLRARMRFLRSAVEKAEAEGLPWQAVMEAVRPSVQALWSTLCLRDQKRFLRHVVRYWDVHIPHRRAGACATATAAGRRTIAIAAHALDL